MNTALSKQFLMVTERAAIATARTMGQGDRRLSDRVATEAMRDALQTIDIIGTVVIGEGERDKAPMLYVGEKVGCGVEGQSIEIDIAVDPLEGTNMVATGTPNAICVLAASEKGGLLKAPDIYMEKIIVGPTSAGKIDITAPVKENLKAIAQALDRDVRDLVVVVLDRPRHQDLIEDIRQAGARIKLIGDGDLSAGISAAVAGTGVHAVMGIGGAPEGVLTAAALRCLGGEIQARFVVYKAEDKRRLQEEGITDYSKIYTTKDLAPGEHIIFVATGATNGELLRGVRFFGGGARTESIVMETISNTVRFVDTIHLEKGFKGAVRLLRE